MKEVKGKGRPTEGGGPGERGSEARRPYRSPRLICYGTLTELTRSGGNDLPFDVFAASVTTR